MSFVPPVPPVSERPLSLLRFLSAVRTNGTQLWPRAAYDDDQVVVRAMGRTRVLLNAPEAIAHVLVSNTDNYRRSPASIRILRPITGTGLLLSEGDAWRHQRRTIAPALAPRMMPVLSRHIAAASAAAVASLDARAGQPVDLLRAMQDLALDVAGRSMFSLEMGAHGDAMRALLMRYAETLGRPYLLDLFVPARFATPRDHARRRFMAEWMGYIDMLMRPRMACPPPEIPRDLFDMLRAARDPETGEAFGHDNLRDQTATMITAGHETTSTTLFWALYLLVQDRAAQAWVAEEASGVDLSPEHAAASLAGLVRTRAVVSEALRLYPAAWTLARQAIGPDRVGGTDIPAGSIVFVSPWVLHRHRKLWREPNSFIADRFIDFTPAKLAYMPFGAGPRICVGAQFALTEATIMLAAMVRAFDVELISTRPVLPAPVVTTQPDHAPLFRLRRRAQALPLAA